MKKKEKKNRVISVLLAIYTGIFTWLYSYKDDNTKFWGCLVAIILLFWTIIVPLGIYIWALVDAITKKDSNNYTWK